MSGRIVLHENETIFMDIEYAYMLVKADQVLVENLMITLLSFLALS